MANAERAPRIEPLRRQVVVRRSTAEAFHIFTARIGAWWPLRDRYTVFQEYSQTCVIEPRVGGLVYEVSTRGERSVWGTVLAWEPPHRLVLSWHPGRGPETAQELEVRFLAVVGGTRVELEHRGWEKLGDAALETRGGYEKGWVYVLATCYVEACK
jgi:uncharacterized protein YndB with AHSA1/START domain